MNKIILKGNICKDIEVKETASGKKMISNTLGVRRDFKNANGEYESDFINIILFGNSCEYLSKYAKKGIPILIEGRLQTGTYQREDGSTAYTTSVVVEHVEILKFGERTESTEQIEESGFDAFGDVVELDDNFLD